MKKIIFTIALSVLLLTVPTVFSLSLNHPEYYSKLSTTEDAPSWAIGNFSGKWAYDLFGAGIPWPPLGTLTGYYGIGYNWSIRIGHFLVNFSKFDGDNAATLEGIFFGPYLFGKYWTDDDTNKTSFVGIGQYNESSSEFIWRLMGFKGSTFYMWGNSTKFE